ncbi:MAG: hypothetical protein IPL79_06155 [Myxococcales bacterium]|nr:hypothetical protein [Myxococcales bacterium]
MSKSLASRVYMRFVLGLVVVALGACLVPTEDVTAPPPCPDIAYAPERNPETGSCENRNEWDCNMGPQTGGPGGPMPPTAPMQAWAACGTVCEQLGEADCDANGSCQTAYIDGSFWGCWEINYSLAWEGLVSCDQLDASMCSGSSECNPNYVTLEVFPDEQGNWDLATAFDSCSADTYVPPLSCANVLCNVGTHCELIDPNGEVCFEDEATPPDCQPACIANGDEPGTCYGDVVCNAAPPACPGETLPGIAFGCWSGYCIPVSACEPAPMCEAVSGEASCIARPDCAPLYQQCLPTEDCMYKYWGCTSDLEG